MVNILPFQRTSQLINEIDQYIDKVSEAVMVLERAIVHYLDEKPDDEFDERVKQIRSVEMRGDELRRSIANVMYGEMLMPDTRGDVMSLLSEVDVAMDNCVHMLTSLAIERPELPEEYVDGFKSVTMEVVKAMHEMLRGARAYFKEPHAVRDHVQKVNFHDQEATTVALRVGKAIFQSNLPLERKRQLVDRLAAVRELGSEASDIGDQLAIFAVKRSI